MTVHFIGAGPGAADLLTVRAVRLLAASPVCVYAGTYLDAEVLSHCPPDATLIDSSGLSLDRITEHLVGAHAAGQDVARLCSGDPSLYSALAEQARRLDRAGVPWAVTPGVPAYAAAAAILGRELTVPELAPVVDLVVWVEDGVAVAANHLGRVRLHLDGRHEVVSGQDPVASTDPMAFLPYAAELAAPGPRVSTDNAYPYAARRILSAFADADRSPDLAVVHTPRHFFPDEGGHRGEHRRAVEQHRQGGAVGERGGHQRAAGEQPFARLLQHAQAALQRLEPVLGKGGQRVAQLRAVRLVEHALHVLAADQPAGHRRALEQHGGDAVGGQAVGERGAGQPGADDEHFRHGGRR